jgi:hypothetical protein
MSHRHEFGDEAVGCTEICDAVCLEPTIHGGDPDITNPDGTIAGGPTEHLAGFIVRYDWPGVDHRLAGGVNVDPHFGDRADHRIA